MQVIATGIAVLIVEKLGRKILLISSAVVQALSIICLGVYFWEKEHSCTELGLDATDDCVDDATLKDIGFLPLVSTRKDFLLKFCFSRNLVVELHTAVL